MVGPLKADRAGLQQNQERSCVRNSLHECHKHVTIGSVTFHSPIPDSKPGKAPEHGKREPSSTSENSFKNAWSTESERALKRPAESFDGRSPPHPAAKLPRPDKGGREHGQNAPPGSSEHHERKGGAAEGGAGPSGGTRGGSEGGSNASQGGERACQLSCPVCFMEFESGTDEGHMTAHVEEVGVCASTSSSGPLFYLGSCPPIFPLSAFPCQPCPVSSPF
jgi:hypothetical protein